MSGVKSRKWTLNSHFVGLPKREDMEIVEEELPALQDGGKLFQSCLASTRLGAIYELFHLCGI